jgi:hypothetical protein
MIDETALTVGVQKLPFNRNDWTFVDNDTDVALLAELQIGATARIYQLFSGMVIVVMLAQFVRRGERPQHRVIYYGEYAAALRFCADEVDAL